MLESKLQLQRRSRFIDRGIRFACFDIRNGVLENFLV